MTVSRRTVLQAVPVTALLGGLAACSTGSRPTGSATSGATASLALDTTAWRYDATGDVYYQTGLTYVSSPQAPDYETLGVFVPGAYMDGTDNGDGTYTATVRASGTVGSFTAATAPVVYPVNTPGYSAQRPPTGYSYASVQAYMEAGFVYVHAGLRGKDSVGDSYSGNAPWGVTDLKAAVRYLRYNADVLPGDSTKVYVFGHSGGGAQSAVAGASGDSALFTPYLTALGAAMTNAAGATLSDAVAGAMCWCPITSLGSADAAYEWNMGQFATTSTRAEGTWTRAYCADLAAAYPAYLNALGLKDADGTALTLQASASGTYLAGTYYDHLVGVIQDSLNEFLAVTTFPYTPSSTHMAGMDGQGGGPDGGEAPSGGPDGGSVGPGLPTGPGANSDTPPGGGRIPETAEPAARTTDGGADTSSTTYATVEDYIASLNATTTWVTYDAATNTATITGLADFVVSQKPPSKDVGAFDGVGRGQTENVVMGRGASGLHFSAVCRDVVAAGEHAYAALGGWSPDYGSSAYDTDLAATDPAGTTTVTRVDMYDPLSYLTASSQYAGTSTVAPAWRIRTGLTQGDTASTVELNLALALRAAGVGSVDFATVWGQGHTMAESAESGETNFIAWVTRQAAG
ncbi:subtype A tannase [Actinomyces sp. HMT897]|uniref:subtype A tannase n=1 Tax=Actinomyces sp. HMT897 TaxID=2789424 RepID=UPI00190C4C27|nr:subtype A tannase [Actinomyces sp. HMT897]QQO78389.1 carboxylesterase family protein [Actinomyces sp. HMT897]